MLSYEDVLSACTEGPLALGAFVRGAAWQKITWPEPRLEPGPGANTDFFLKELKIFYCVLVASLGLNL